LKIVNHQDGVFVQEQDFVEGKSTQSQNESLQGMERGGGMAGGLAEKRDLPAC